MQLVYQVMNKKQTTKSVTVKKNEMGNVYLDFTFMDPAYLQETSIYF